MGEGAGERAALPAMVAVVSGQGQGSTEVVAEATMAAEDSWVAVQVPCLADMVARRAVEARAVVRPGVGMAQVA